MAPDTDHPVFRSFIVLRATLCQLAIVASALTLPSISTGAERGEVAVDEPATSQGDPLYANDLVARARDAHLESDVQWLRLGHWHRGLSGDVRGEPDGPLFWLATRGKADPAAELEATIRGIWAPETQDPHVQHPFCRFPARMMWLDEKLHLDATRLPRRNCARYGEFVKKLRPGSVALVFSSYFLNNPASAFGHTFLRIHKAGAARSSELLDTGIDFSAQVDTTNALLYAVKGLAGLFPGMFHSLPFYYKVREYNDYESRDLWEYELDLSPRAVAMIVAHLWEEGSTYFDYFYLSENCSYHVLAALEVGDPSLHLLSHLRNPVVPVDTVRALFAEKGLVREVHYRPSLRATLRHELATLTREETDALGALIVDPEASFPEGMPPQARAQTLDAANDLVDVRESEAVLKGDDPRVSHLKQRLLERRAEIPVATDVPPVPVPFDKMPQVGHATSRIGLGTGYSRELGGDFYELRYRLALHDLTDPPDGYPETSELEFLPTRLRLYPKESSLELEELSVLRIMSLSPWSRFQHSLSWAINTGVNRVRDSGCPNCLAGLVDLAAGVTFGSGSNDAFVFYALADLGIKYASRMHGVADSDWRLGVGPLGGVRWRLARSLIWTADAAWSWLPLAKPNGTWLAETSARWGLAPDVALGFDLRFQPLATDGVLSAMLYY